MINKPTVSDLLQKTENRYDLVIATAKRARQLAEGRAKLIETNEENPVTIAANEINVGKVKIIDEAQLSKDSDQILREQEEEELRKLEQDIKEQILETKLVEQVLTNKYTGDEETFEDSELLELMNGAGILDDDNTLGEINLEDESKED